jgi:hypothetical protein
MDCSVTRLGLRLTSGRLGEPLWSQPHHNDITECDVRETNDIMGDDALTRPPLPKNIASSLCNLKQERLRRLSTNFLITSIIIDKSLVSI